MVIPQILNHVTADINLDVSILSSNDSLFTNALTTDSIRDVTAGLVYKDHCCCLLRLWLVWACRVRVLVGQAREFVHADRRKTKKKSAARLVCVTARPVFVGVSGSAEGANNT